MYTSSNGVQNGNYLFSRIGWVLLDIASMNKLFLTLFIGLFLGVVGFSSAAVTPDSFYQKAAGSQAFTSKTDYDAVCRAYVTAQSSTFVYGGSTLIAQGYGSDRFTCYYGPNAANPRILSANGGYYQCPAATPYINESTGSCSGTQIDPCADTNPMIRKFYYTAKGSYITPDHFGSCEIAPASMLVCRSDTVGTYCMWEVRRTGRLWSGTDVTGNGGSPAASNNEVKTDPQTTSPTIRNPTSKPDICPTCVPCPGGSVQAGIDVDGVPLCVGTGTNPPDPVKSPTTTTKPATSSTDQSGTTTTLQDVLQQNADGSTTTTTTTTTVKADGTKTITVNAVTSNTPTGNAGKTDTPSADQANLCKQNPGLTICQTSSVAGTCGEITCKGDAIQCATLRAAAAMQCKQKKDDDDLKASPLNTLGAAAAAGNDPLKDSLPTATKASVVTMPTIEAGGWLGSGSFFKDKVIALPGGQQLVLPLSQAADVMIALRYVTMIVCSMASFAIIRQTFTSSGV